MAKVFLFPVFLCLLWTLFLHFNGVPLKQGKKGFVYIIAISTTVILSLGLLLWVTAEQNIRS